MGRPPDLHGLRDNTLVALWRAWDRALLSDAGDVQRSEMRRAFFSGAAAALQLCTTVATELPDDAACAALDGWLKECTDFGQAIAEGRA